MRVIVFGFRLFIWVVFFTVQLPFAQTIYFGEGISPEQQTAFSNVLKSVKENDMPSRLEDTLIYVGKQYVYELTVFKPLDKEVWLESNLAQHQNLPSWRRSSTILLDDVDMRLSAAFMRVFLVTAVNADVISEADANDNFLCKLELILEKSEEKFVTLELLVNQRFKTGSFVGEVTLNYMTPDFSDSVIVGEIEGGFGFTLELNDTEAAKEVYRYFGLE
jgi:hypothetical protein